MYKKENKNMVGYLQKSLDYLQCPQIFTVPPPPPPAMLASP